MHLEINHLVDRSYANEICEFQYNKKIKYFDKA